MSLEVSLFNSIHFICIWAPLTLALQLCKKAKDKKTEEAIAVKKQKRRKIHFTQNVNSVHINSYINKKNQSNTQ